MRRVAVVALCAFVAGCGSKSETDARVSNVKPVVNFDRIVLGYDFRIKDLNEKGFDILIATGFAPSGEEKVIQTAIKASWPIDLPASSTWQTIESSPVLNQERYLAGKHEITIKWVPPSSSSKDATFVNLVVVSPAKEIVSTRPEETKSAFRWASSSSKTEGERITREWVGNLVLPPWQTDSELSEEKPSKFAVSLPVVSVDGDARDDAFVRVAVNALSHATQRPYLPVSKYGFAPFGLNNSLYFGHTFWDMDVWVLPSMLFLQPEAVRQMNQYRLDRAGQAEKNAAEYFKRPDSGMKFPWESSVSGKETVPGPSQKEHHISGSVLWGLNLSEKAGITPQGEVAKVAGGVGKFFSLRSNPGPNGREIKEVMSPDENHIGDNDLYTNLLAQWAMNGRKWEGPNKFKLPKDAKSFLSYDGDAERGYKQAAAVLSIFPLQYPEAERQARVMMERFETKVSKNGPAMTDAIHATIWARLGEKEKAYDAWKRAWEPFVRGPQMMFSEKRSSDRTYFYTGAAGCLNTVLYGFAGFRFDEKPAEGALWKKQLKSGWWISCKPQLPPKWKSLRISPMIFDGVKYNVEVRIDAVQVELSK